MHRDGPATLRFGDAERPPIILPPLLTIGKGTTADLVVDDDTVSRLHASIEQVGLAWVVTDLGSRNGTWVNGQRVLTRVLHDEDEILVGRTRLLFDAPTGIVDGSATSPTVPPPDLTAERQVLLALCRPVLGASLLTGTASVAAMAGELGVSGSAVKKAIARLYDKFGLYEDERRAGRLAAEAIMRGAVAAADLRADPTPAVRPQAPQA